MKRRLLAAAALACSAAVGVAARDDQPIMVRGCVQNFSSTGSSGTTERGYILSNTEIVRDSSSGAPMPAPSQGTTAAGTPTGTSGTAAAGMPTSAAWAATSGAIFTSPARVKSSYRLDAAEVQLKEYVGRKVEITGSVERRGSGAAKGEAGRLHVASLRVISPECSK